MDTQTLRRGDENRSMTPIKTQRQVRPHSPECLLNTRLYSITHRTSPCAHSHAAAVSSCCATSRRIQTHNCDSSRKLTNQFPDTLSQPGGPLHPQPQRAGPGHRALQPRQGERQRRRPRPRQRGHLPFQGKQAALYEIGHNPTLKVVFGFHDTFVFRDERRKNPNNLTTSRRSPSLPSLASIQQEEYKKQLASNFLQDGGNSSAKILAFKSKVRRNADSSTHQRQLRHNYIQNTIPTFLLLLQRTT
jgi:hypothetical protein